MRVVSYTRTTTCVPFEDVPSDVIKQQNNRIQFFCKKHKFKISYKYSDRKHDAKEETEFRELLNDGMNHKFDLVVVDSIYRAGSYIGSAREVLCKTLHFSGINFAVVEDGFISIDKSNSEVISYIDGKYNEFYKLQKKQYALKRLQDGVFTKGEAKYGFDVIDGRLVINEYQADIVRRIFQECVSGKSVREIAEGLNKDNITEPSKARGMKTVNKDGWNPSGIRNMMRNALYKGDLYRRYEDVIVKCDCPAIVSAEIFDDAQIKIRTTKKIGDCSRKSVFSGIVRDIDDSISYVYEKSFDGNYVYKIHPTTGSTKNCIPYDEVYDLVISLFANVKNDALRIANLIRTEGDAVLGNIRDDIANRMRELAFRLASIEKEKMNFTNVPEFVYTERSEIENKFLELENELAIMEKAISLDNPWLVRFMNLDDSLEITKDNLKKVIKKIYFDKCEFDHFEFLDQKWYELLPENWRL